jgi:hypothetical protein
LPQIIDGEKSVPKGALFSFLGIASERAFKDNEAASGAWW